jgi:hypothetical protein
VCLDFFSFKFWVDGVGGAFFFHFTFVPNMFPLCYLQVPSEFPSGSQSSQCVPKGVPNSFSLYPICFAQSPPLLTYIAGPKGEALHPSIESFILGELP